MKKSLFVILMLAGLCAYALAREAVQIQSVPGSVSQGEQVLRQKGCLDCHSLSGQGGNRAPDFAMLSDEADTPARMATAIWNHGPRMWAEYESGGRPIPSFTQNDAADVFSYFFAILYFEPQGNSQRGRSVFIQKNCVQCHSDVLNPERLDPFFSRWMQLRDPTGWAESFWNHANEMDSATALRGIRWPELSPRDAADLMTFLSSLPGTPSEGPAFTIGEPLDGKPVFERSCGSCHSLGSTERGKVDLLRRSRKTSLAGYIAAMWNHAPEMRRRGGAVPKLAAGEMDDVIGYLFLQQYFYAGGDAARGRRVYEAKGCAGCHEGTRETGAPDLTRTALGYTPISMAASVWGHGPAMAATLTRQGRNWPQMQESEMTDLLAYLNSLLRPQVAE
jgi:cytochrome c2